MKAYTRSWLVLVVLAVTVVLEYATHTPAAEAYRKLAEVVDR